MYLPATIPITFTPVSVSCDGMSFVFAAGDASALQGCRPYLAWRPAGTDAWREEIAARIDVITCSPREFIGSTQLGPCRMQFSFTRREDEAWVLAGSLTNMGDTAVELARCHYLHGEVATTDIGLLAITMGAMEGQFIRHGTHVPPTRQSLEEAWAGMQVFWPRLAEPIHDCPDWATSVDAGILVPTWTAPGWLLGTYAPGTAFGEIGMHTQTTVPAFYLGVLLDNIVLAPGDTRDLEESLLLYGDWQDGLAVWARACADAAGVTSVCPPLVGYCSWYQHYDRVTADHFLQAIDEFADWPIPPGGRLVQLDDGYQRTPGDWRPNERFAAQWEDLPSRIAATGSLPGLWLAPTVIQATHPLAEDHPDWLQRLPNGKPAVTFSNWGWCDDSAWQWPQPGVKGLYLDPDHPEARAWMRALLQDVAQQGWRYLKLDFTYPISTARAAYDRSKTYFETLRDLYRLFREACGPEMLLNACIGVPGRYALGEVDVARLGFDIGGEWMTVAKTLSTLFLRMCTNGVWWQADPDVFFMRQTASHLTEEESFVLTGTVGLLGGIFLTSDYPSQWTEEAKRLVREFWTEEGPRPPASQRIVLTSDGIPLAYRVSYEDSDSPRHQIGLYNWTEAPQMTQIPLAALQLNPAQAWRVTSLPHDGEVRLEKGVLVVEQQPPHSLRIARLSS